MKYKYVLSVIKREVDQKKDLENRLNHYILDTQPTEYTQQAFINSARFYTVSV